MRTLLSNIVSQQEQTPPLPQPDPLTDAQRLVQEIIDVDEAAEDPPASALHRQILGLPLTTQEPEEPDWEACEDVLGTAPPCLTILTTPTTRASSASTSGITTKAQPATAGPTATMATQVRFGVDLGGVLWPAMGRDITVHRVMRIGALPKVVEWMASLVNCIGAENVFIVSKVGHRGQQTWAKVLQQSGFYREKGMLEANVHWVRERTGPRGKSRRPGS